MKQLFFIFIFSLALTTATAAEAGILYTSPSGSGSACTETNRCLLTQALSQDHDGDEIRLTNEEYSMTSRIDVDVANLTISGPPGRINPGDNRAFIIFKTEADGAPAGFDSFQKIVVTKSGFHLERVSIVGRANGSFLFNANQNPSLSGIELNRVYISDDGSTTGTLIGDDVKIRNSHLSRNLAGCPGFLANVTGQIIGSTFISSCGAIVNSTAYHTPTSGDSCTLAISNTISVGVSYNLQANRTSPSGPTVCEPNTSYSNSWIPTADTGGGILNPLGYVSAGSGNLANNPLALPSPFSGSIEIPASSTAVNAGCSGAACGSEDFYGRPRPIGSANDIGAFEATLLPVVSSVSVSDLTASSAKLTASINPNGGPSSYNFAVRKAGASSWTNLPTALSGNGVSAEVVSATAASLDTDSDYQARLVATNSAGEGSSAEITSFRTAAIPPLPTPSLTVSLIKPKISKKALIINSRVKLSGPGKVEQTVATGSGKKTKIWCRVKKTITSAGSYSLSCNLGKKGRRYIQQKSRKFNLRTSFTPSGQALIKVAKALTIKKKR